MSEETTKVENGNGSSGEWNDFIKPFAEAISMSVDDVTTKLKSLVGEPGPAAIAALRKEEFTPLDDIKAAIGEGVATAVLRMAVAQHLRGSASEEEATPAQHTILNTSLDVLPDAPTDEDWLRMLKTGGQLKVDKPVVISAIRAALASRSGLYDLPQRLVKLMEAHAEELEEPIGGEFFKLRKMLTQRSYAEIFAALDVDGQFVSQSRKSALIGRLDESLWPTLLSFHGQLKEWTEAWQAGIGNPAAVLASVAAMAGGAGAMPPGMMQPPATDGLRDAAESVNDRINKVFAGVGIPIAMALAYDALRIKEVLSKPELPLQVGAANRDQMLRKLGVSVSADYVRLERNLTRYALSVMEYPNVTAGQEELGFLTSLLMLGSQIPWDKLGTAPKRREGGRGIQ